jgi:hypothetical protein
MSSSETRHDTTYIIYSVPLSVHEDVTPRGVKPPLQLLLPLNLTLFVYRHMSSSESWHDAAHDRECTLAAADTTPSDP